MSAETESKNKLPIALDVMGGDYAPREIMKGAMEAVAEDGVEVVLVGREDQIRHHISTSNRLSIVHAPEVIGFDESPVKAVRDKPNSSIAVGLNLLKNGEAFAFVSAGSTGAVVYASLSILGMAEGVDRPAISAFYYTPSGPVLLLDIGATADCQPRFLLQFALLGDLYMRKVVGISNPRIGLLSIGEEEGKGNRLVREAYQLLKESRLNFIGNVEGQDIFQRTAQVVVTDGFTGNVLIKALEGFSNSLVHLAPFQKGGLKYRLAGLLVKPLVGIFKRRLQYTQYGGAPLLGVKGNVIKAHGWSKAKAIRSALRQAQRMAEEGLSQILIEGENGKADKCG